MVGGVGIGTEMEERRMTGSEVPNWSKITALKTFKRYTNMDFAEDGFRKETRFLFTELRNKNIALQRISLVNTKRSQFVYLTRFIRSIISFISI